MDILSAVVMDAIYHSQNIVDLELNFERDEREFSDLTFGKVLMVYTNKIVSGMTRL